MEEEIRLTQTYLERFIKFFATSSVVKRGKQLYQNNAVRFDSYNEPKDTFRFLVNGSEIYRVRIKGVANRTVETSCSCPFDWGGICKHTVASLLFISDNYPFNGEVRIIEAAVTNADSKKKSLRSKKGFELTDYKTITVPYVETISSSRVLIQLEFLSDTIIFNKVEITKDSITFIAENPQNTVRFFSEDKKVYVASSAINNSQKLSLPETSCLLSIANSPIPYLLNDVFSGRVIEKQKSMLEAYGLPADADFNEYFYYYFDEEAGLLYQNTKKTVGLIPVLNVQNSQLLKIINQLSSNNLELTSHASLHNREIGFVLKSSGVDFEYYDDFSDFDNEGSWEIVPIIGKPNKTRTSFSAHISVLSDLESSQFQTLGSENTKQLLRILEELDAAEELEEQSKAFDLLKTAFNLLKKETFVFGLKDGKYEIKRSTLERIILADDPLDIVFEVSKNSNFLNLTLKIKIGESFFKRDIIDPMNDKNYIFKIKEAFYFVKSQKVSTFLFEYPPFLKMVATHRDEFFEHIIKPISQNFSITYKKGTFKSELVELDFHKKQIYLSEQDDYIIFTPQVVYDHNVNAILNTAGNVLSKSDNTIIEYQRNFELENDFIDLIATLHPGFDIQKNNKQFFLHYDEFTENMWFYGFFDKLQADNVEVYGLKDLKNFKYSPYKGKISTSVSSGQDWFEVNVDVSFGDNRVSLNDIKKAVINHQKYIQLKDGSVGVLPTEWLHKLEKYFRNGEIRKNKLEISKLRFSIVDELFDNIDDAEIINEITEKRDRLAGFSEITTTKIPKQIKADLRPYQKEGINWLNFLDEMKWGGILADDMGLGKTLQILTFLQQHANKKKTTSLVVVPTTLLFNWKNEIQKFSPKLKALYYYGTNRNKDTELFSNYHIVFTTYGILLRDIEILNKFEFHYAILDESQAIKNPASRRYKAANLIHAKNRIALTGTPIENGTFDLFAQMNFVNRGFFGSAKAFRENYSNPIDKENDELVATELQKISNPFVLRRTKEKVASELPPKTEDIIYCEMESGQRKVYDAYRNKYKNQLLNKIEDDGMGKSKIMVLEALTRLRQICDSPVLLNSDEITENQSVKIKEIMRHITDKTGNHKILIFSQFVKMLEILKDELTKQNIDFEYLDGKNNTKQREQSVNNFQKNESLRVFLISLKAGGTGLNLTAADYVYILDPWWNPAVENQAIDRCYRIGQDKKVFAYRMICTNTVEEKIINLQNKKKKIAGDIIQSDENIMKKLNVNDIKELFS